MTRGLRARLISVILVFCLGAIDARAEVERVVILKADGLPFDILDSFVRKKDPYTGKSVLPWIDQVFYAGGTRLRSFYSRGLSLSAPSWALLDTGQPSVIKGNLEFDRLTLHAYDYLDVFLHVIKNAAGHEVSTPGAQVLDEQRVPLLADAYLPSDRFSSIQLFVRGLPSGLGSAKRMLTLQNPKEWLDEWTIGFEGSSILSEVLERDLIAKLKNPDIHYLDFLIPVFDHTAHLNRDPEALLRALQQIDEAVRRVWTAIEQSPLAEKTVLVVVSDHGMNTDPAVYSQGYSLIDLFTSGQGGGHHVVTNRPPLGEYALKSLSPVVPLITTASPSSHYLKGQSTTYPTLLLDADGNERASIYFRNSNMNVLQILWQQLARKNLRPEIRLAANAAFFAVLERNRRNWDSLVVQLRQQLEALHRSILQLEKRPKPKSKIDKNRQEVSSVPSTLAAMKADESTYAAYVRSLANLLSLRPDSFDPSRLRIEDFLAEHAMGDLNTVYDLQNYVAGGSGEELALRGDGSLDMAESFTRINYFSLLTQIKTRNNLQEQVSARPVDFIAMKVPVEALRSDLLPGFLPIDNAIWLFRDDDRQALILSRRAGNGQLWLRYLPVGGLKQDADGQIHFSASPWRDKLPLEPWEGLPGSIEQRRLWLDAWHTESEWMIAFHATAYSNAVISLYEQFAFSSALSDRNPEQTDDLLLRFRERKRQLAQADFIVFANDHWNFNYRGFNPGGNHGSFFRASTHATLMFAGGPATGIPEGLAVDRPYDSLSFVPTILTLIGKINTQGLSKELTERGFRALPGPVI